MKQTQLIMGMPITIEILDHDVDQNIFDMLFTFFSSIDETFSTYKSGSEISLINQGVIKRSQYSNSMLEIMKLSEQTKTETGGFFDIKKDDQYDPSGIVKGWAIQKAAEMLWRMNFINFYIDAGGDIQVSGVNSKKEEWIIGIRNPFNRTEHVKSIKGARAVATSGTYIRGNHIYNPHHPKQVVNDIISLTIIGPTIFDADRFATAAFAMGKKGIHFIESLPNFEGYMIDKKGIATYTSGFNHYVLA